MSQQRQPFGIYTLANDVVYDQLIALLNSIDANVGSDIPICVIPFDQRLERCQQAIASRPNVTLFTDELAIARWEKFAQEFVRVHPEAQRTQQKHSRWYGGGLHRKFVAFEGIFDKFVFFDGDSLAMKPLTNVWQQLETYDFVFDDWEHAKSAPHTALDISLIEQTGLFTAADIRPKLHCSSFWGSKYGIFGAEELAILQDRLVNQGEAAWVNGQGWWDDAFLFNYMTLRCDRPLFNFTLSQNGQDRTGNCANVDPFTNVDNVLYNEQGLKPIHRIHYMGYASSDFARLAKGEDADIPYKDIFLHYRFLQEPEQKPTQLKPPSPAAKIQRFVRKAAQKLIK
ncbi:hypothetical protein NDA01_10475 [Trichocoleus desertorum AS-A10]|uniref:Npun_R2821/Npun_R2822 family protein n=1 Tax=Trichocoleus desertorum TaxID=1481672 RepID=UPI00329742B0